MEDNTICCLALIQILKSYKIETDAAYDTREVIKLVEERYFKLGKTYELIIISFSPKMHPQNGYEAAL